MSSPKKIYIAVIGRAGFSLTLVFYQMVFEFCALSVWF